MDDSPQTNGTADPPFADTPAISQSLAELEEELQRLKSAAEHIEASKEAALKAAETADGVRASTGDLSESAQRLVEEIDDVDFPSRIDKINASIESVEAEVEGIRSEVDGVRPEVDGIRSEVDSVRSEVEGIPDQIQSVSEKQAERLEEALQATEQRVVETVESHYENVERLHDETRQTLAEIQKWTKGAVLLGGTALLLVVLFAAV
jgi:chromosome segregation ATPase